MERFDFLKTGRGEAAENRQVEEFANKAKALLCVLAEEGINTAFNIARSCGRQSATPTDMRLALMYECHHFLERNIDDKFAKVLKDVDSEWEKYTEKGLDRGDDQALVEEGEEDDSVSEDGDSCGDDSLSEDGQSAMEEDDDMTNLLESDHYRLKDGSYAHFFNEVCKIYVEWEDWSPEDPVQQLLKRAVDADQGQKTSIRQS